MVFHPYKISLYLYTLRDTSSLLLYNAIQLLTFLISNTYLNSFVSRKPHLTPVDYEVMIKHWGDILTVLSLSNGWYSSTIGRGFVNA